jgi:hypothetical protein
MITGQDASFDINRVNLTAPNGQVYDFSDVASPGTSIINIDTVQVLECAIYGVINDILTLTLNNSNMLDADQGLSVRGSNIAILSLRELAFTTSSASFIGVDLESSVAQNIELTDLVGSGPAGSIGVSGTNSDNIAAGQTGSFRDSNFFGGMTANTGFNEDDFRWIISGVSGEADTRPDWLVQISNNALETEIDTVNVPEKVNAVWTDISSSQFSVSTDGRVSYLGERPVRVPITLTAGAISAASLNNVYMCLTKNIDDGGGVVACGVSVTISSTKATALGTIVHQETMEQGDYLDLYVTNTTNNQNIVIEDARSRGN